jgi:hypothetical protein
MGSLAFCQNIYIYIYVIFSARAKGANLHIQNYKNAKVVST